MSTIRSRLILIAILTVVAILALLPRNETQRVPDAVTGRMKDTTVRRVPIHLGLDLQGGVHLALEVDQTKGPVPDCADAIQRAERVVRARIDEFGTTEPVVQIVGRCRLVVELAGEKDPARATSIVQRTAFLEFRITDMKNLFRDALPGIDRALALAGVRGTAPVSSVAQLLGGDTAKTPKGAKPKGKTPAPAVDTANANALSSLLFQGQLPGEFLVPDEQVARADSLLAHPEAKALIPRGLDLKWGTDVQSRGARLYRALYAVEDKPIITGEELTKATARRDQLNNHSVVVFDLTRRGSRKFCDATGQHVRDYMAIMLDGKVVGQPPIINDQICGTGQIDLQSKPLTEAQDLALVLRAGALPAPLAIVDEKTIGPSLGADSIHDGIKAGIAGVVLVVLIMVGYYRLSGVLAVSALTLYVLFTLAGLSGFGFTLTLPGMAGFVLSIGMAVDSNVLIFERIREELQHGKTLRTSVDEGFRHAMSAIIDSNAATALTAFILYEVGTGPVQGFAITLIIGIGASFLTAVFVVRTFYMIWLQRRPDMVTLSI
ncbi:MAG TPA: protein translocase subunit SecD [Gemmatimonadales bacterium]|nr:protein translocase subunit SecD [Gemmatimonadales bacterium]